MQPTRDPRLTTSQARRRLLLAALAAPALPLQAAPYAADGPALPRAGALKSNLLDLVFAGPRLVAVGERGHVLLSDDQGKTWRQARAVPTRTTLTAVHAVDARTLVAAGHGGVVLRSSDAGETWTVATGKADGADVLLAIRVEPSGFGLAVGGFGVALSTSDGGQTWRGGVLVDGEAGEKHLNRIVASRSGAWLVAAEGGMVMRSPRPAEGGWAAVKTPYAGSLWTGLQLPGGALVLGGMRGNVVRSADDGQTWTHHASPEAGSLTGAAVLPDGRPVLVGVDGTLLVGDAQGASFRLRRLEDRATLTATVALPGGGLVATTGSGPRRIEVPAQG